MNRKKIAMNAPAQTEAYMLRRRLQTLKIMLTSEYWLIVALSGAFFTFFALNRGGIVVFVHACFVLLVINIATGTYRLRQIPRSYWITAGVFAYLLLASALFYPKISHYRWMGNPVRMLFLVFAIHCLSRKKIGDRTAILLFSIVSVAVCWQFVAYTVFKLPYGTFSNPHYIANFSILTLPVVAYALLVTEGWYRYLFALTAVLDLLLVLKIGSRPAITGLVFGTLFVVVFLTQGRRRWIGLLLVLAGIGILFLTQYAGVTTRFETLIANLPKEERVQLWIDTWGMLKDNTLMAWIMGNGIGGFHAVYPERVSAAFTGVVSPHNYLLEILYDNGMIGVILVFGAMLALFISGLRAALHAPGKKLRILMKCMIVIFISWFVHTGFTFPFYSKYAQYSLSFVLGVMLVLIDKAKATQNKLPVS